MKKNLSKFNFKNLKIALTENAKYFIQSSNKKYNNQLKVELTTLSIA